MGTAQLGSPLRLLDFDLGYVDLGTQGTGDGRELVQGGLKVADDLLGDHLGRQAAVGVVEGGSFIHVMSRLTLSRAIRSS